MARARTGNPTVVTLGTRAQGRGPRSGPGLAAGLARGDAQAADPRQAELLRWLSPPWRPVEADGGGEVPGPDVAGLREAALAQLRDRVGPAAAEVAWVEADAEGAGRPGDMAVARAGCVLGWLRPGNAADAVDQAQWTRWADWLADWLRAGSAAADLWRQAMSDDLTGLWNRRYFRQCLEGALTRLVSPKRQRGSEVGAGVALFLVDLDDFKRFNDAFGHDTGDRVLRAAADALRGALDPDDVACRIGGDEFAVVFREGSVANGADFHGRVRRCVAVFREALRRVRLDGVDHPLTISAGLAWRSGAEGDEPDAQALARSLFALADAGVLAAKRGGRDRVAEIAGM